MGPLLQKCPLQKHLPVCSAWEEAVVSRTPPRSVSVSFMQTACALPGRLPPQLLGRRTPACGPPQRLCSCGLQGGLAAAVQTLPGSLLQQPSGGSQAEELPARQPPFVEGQHRWSVPAHIDWEDRRDASGIGNSFPVIRAVRKHRKEHLCWRNLLEDQTICPGGTLQKGHALVQS